MRQKVLHTIIDKHGFDYVNHYQYQQYPNTDAQYETSSAPPVGTTEGAVEDTSKTYLPFLFL
jgi:hypothetical protein